MKCFFHNDRDATAICQDCGRCLCPQCASGHSRAICVDCHVMHNASSRKRIYINLATLMIIFIAFIFTLHGLKVFSEKKSCFFIVGGLFWLFYIYFKLAFSFLVGLVVGRVRIFRMFGELLILHRSDAEMQAQLEGGT